MDRTDIKNKTADELGSYLASIGEKSYRAKQILVWIYKKGVLEFNQMTNLSVDLRRKLESAFFIGALKLIDKKVSSIDKTTKYLFQLQDENLLESVLIPNLDRLTACLSTQVGCKFGCKFCASGKDGFIRNLVAAEMINQLLSMSADILPGRISNIVFMGMGESLDNYLNLVKAIRIINNPDALNIGARKITISTCGLPQGIKRLSEENIQVELSVSLHTANNKLRSSLMPINKKHPLEELISACRRYTERTRRIITFEYLLIKDTNDRKKDAENLLRLLDGLKCKLNLILYNSFLGAEFLPPEIERAVEFQKAIKTGGIFASLRQSKGGDIEAACGQLRLKKIKTMFKNKNALPLG